MCVSSVAIFELAMKSVACESGMTSSVALAHAVKPEEEASRLRTLSLFGAACRCSRSLAIMCNDF